MLSVAKLRVGQEAYHLSGVAQSLDAYYRGDGEAAGVWLGGSAHQLGLTGDVTADDLRAVLAGIRPGTGGLTPNGDTVRPHPRRVPGFDLTFKAPKSASVLYAVSDDPRVQGAIIDAGETALASAVAWLEHHTVRVRRGTNNRAFLAAHPDATPATDHPVHGVIAAAFRHRTSRASDPLLHWHVLVANLARGLDGRWSSIVHPALYRDAKAAGEVFQAVFRHELTASLGVQWRPGRHVPEIAGIPDRVLEQFSKRTDEITAWLTATGTPDTPTGRQRAVLATRRRKADDEHTRFDHAWKAEAAAIGWGPDAADALIAHTTRTAPADRQRPVPWTRRHDQPFRERTVTTDEWIATLLDELTTNATTFGTGDLHAAIAARLDTGATRHTIERIAHTVLAAPTTIPAGADRWTTRNLLDVETRFLAALTRPATPLHPGPLPDGLGADQAAALTTVLTSPTALAVLVGPAGTGKTHTVAAIAAAYRHAGLSVHGAAPSARAALELDAVGVPARTLHRVLHDQRGGAHADVLVIDEAAMADIRTLEAVVTTQLDTGGRVLLVGDHHQLPEIGAGGGFAYAARHARCVTELTVNRRQHHPWEHDALRNLRNGDVAAAVDTYLAHGRVTVTADPAELIAAAVDTWFTARTRGERAVLLAGTTATVDTLNRTIATRLATLGETGTPAEFDGRTFRPGERVVVRRNSTEHTPDGHPVTIANGQTGTVHTATPGRIVITLDTGTPVVLTGDYLTRGGHLDHAWALTTHRAQGGTWDTAIAVGTDGLYRQAAYVQLSRGTRSNHLVVTRTELDDVRRDHARHDSTLPLPGEHPDLRDDLVHRLGRHTTKHLAHHDDPDVTLVDHLARTHTRTELDDRHRHAVTVEHDADTIHGFHGPELTRLAAHLEHLAAHLTIGSRVSPTDRHNVGTVTRIDGPGRIHVHFTADTGREATRTFPLDQLRLLDPAATHPIPEPVARHIATLRHQADRWNQYLHGRRVQPGDTTRFARAAALRTRRATHHLLDDPPAWLTDRLGPRPDDVARATTFDDTVTAIADWRDRHHLPDDTPGLGPRPTGTTGIDWDQLTTRITAVAAWLDHPDRRTPQPAPRRDLRALETRRDALDTLLGTAPGFGAAPATPGDDHLDAMLTTARHDWIHAHWPHVVEHHEVTRALHGPDDGTEPHEPNVDTVDLLG